MKIDYNILRELSDEYGVEPVNPTLLNFITTSSGPMEETYHDLLQDAGYMWDELDKSYIKNDTKCYYYPRTRKVYWIWDNSLIKSITLTTDLKEWITENKATEFIEEYLKNLNSKKREPKNISSEIEVDNDFLKSIEKIYGVFPLDYFSNLRIILGSHGIKCAGCERFNDSIEMILHAEGFDWKYDEYAYVKGREKVYNIPKASLIVWEWRGLVRFFKINQIEQLDKWLRGNDKYPEGKANRFKNIYIDHINKKNHSIYSQNINLPKKHMDSFKDPEDPRGKKEKSKEDVLVLKLISLIERGKENLITTDLILDFYNECPTKEMKQKLAWFVKKFDVGGMDIKEGQIRVKDLIRLISEIACLTIAGIKNKKIKLNENKSSNQYIIDFVNKMWPAKGGGWTIQRVDPYRFGGTVYILKHQGPVPEEIYIGQFDNKLYLYYSDTKSGGKWKELGPSEINEENSENQISDADYIKDLANKKWPSDFEWNVVKIVPISNNRGNKYILKRKQSGMDILMVFKVGTTLFGRKKLNSGAWGSTIKLANIDKFDSLDKKHLMDLVNKEWPKAEGSGEWMIKDMQHQSSMPSYILQRTRGMETAEISKIGEDLYYIKPEDGRDVSEISTSGAASPVTTPYAFKKKPLGEMTTTDSGTTGYMIPGAFSRRGGSVKGVEGSNTLGYTLTPIGRKEMERKPDPLYESVIKTIYNEINKKC